MHDGAKMKLFWIGGSHPRHLYYINQICKEFPLSGAIIEIRENLLPVPPEGIAEGDRINFIKHFGNRELAEKKYFGDQKLPECPIYKISRGAVNSEESVDFIKSIHPDLVIVFGSGLIKPPLSKVLPKQTVNLHLGISPRYRGAATLFWPFYFLEPAYAGSTFHYIVDEPDAGEIIHQVTPDLDPADGIHDVACKTVVKSASEAVALLKIFADKGSWVTRKQKASGKNFLESDFKPEHLRVIYNLYNDDIVRQYLEGKLQSKVPQPYRQF